MAGGRIIEYTHSEDKYGDVIARTEKSMHIYREWLELTRRAPRPNNLRRPLWLARPLRPVDEMFYINE